MKIILVLAVAAALAAGGVYLGQTANPVESSLPDGALATVNGYPITESYVQRRIEQLPLGSQIEVRENRAGFVDTVVTEEALLQSVLNNNFAGQTELRDQVKSLVAEHLIATRVRDAIKVTPAQVEQYYQNNQSVIRGETVVIRHILLDERAGCEALLNEIDSAAAFEAAAREQSLDKESGSQGGILGRVMNHNAWLGFEREVFAMSEGEMRVFDGSDGGCHLVRAGARETPSLPELAEVSDRITAHLRREQEIALLRSLVDEVGQQIPIMRRDEAPRVEGQ